MPLLPYPGHLPFPWTQGTWPVKLFRSIPVRHLGLSYDTSWARLPVVRLARLVALEGVGRPMVKMVAAPVAVSADRLQGVEGPVIFAANHASHADTLVLLSMLPERFRHRSVVAAAADYFFDRPWKAVASAGLLSAIPVDRKKVNRRSSDLAVELISEGWSLVIFPEGGRSPDGWGQPFHPASAAYLSFRAKVPVVPIYLTGTRAVLAKGSSKLRRSPTRVTFGEPISPLEGEDVRNFAVRIEESVAELADEGKTGWWGAKRNAARGETPDLRGPAAASWRRAWSLVPAAAVRRSWPN